MRPPAPRSSSHFAALRRHDGFTLILTLLVLLITSLLLVAAFTAANGEVHLTSTDRAEKKAYYAAEAGIEDYEYHLTQDGNYLSYCTSPPSSNPALNQAGVYPLKRATVPSQENGEPTHEEYAIQLLPAESDNISGDHKCDSLRLVETMVEETPGGPDGTFRIESTGYSGGAERTIVATFRNANFVSYVWYTKYETGDPVIYGKPPTTPSSLPNYYNECGGFFGTLSGDRPPQGHLTGFPERCFDNFFFGGESVNGPMHTADHVGVCGPGEPVFGRNENDRIEFGNDGEESKGEGFSNEGICTATTPKFKGKHIPPKEVLPVEPPPGDEELKHVVEPAYLYEGKTEIILEGATMTVIKHKGAGVLHGEVEEKGVAYPPNGVIYVTAANCSEAYSPFGPKPRYLGNEVAAETDTACANVYVHGEYTKSLTIATENDVVINSNLTTPRSGETPSSNALLGLIANNFVRISHPVIETYEGKAPSYETSHVALESALHKETIEVEPQGSLANELRIEVCESGTEFEVLVLNAEGKTLEKTPLLKEASKLIGISSPYVVYKEGPKYNEGKAEKLKALAAGSLGHKEVIKVEAKNPKLGKELQAEVIEEPNSEFAVTIRNEKGEEVEKTPLLKEAKQLFSLSPTPTEVVYREGPKYNEGKTEKLKKASPKWLDEVCNENGQHKVESFNSLVNVRKCEYTDEAIECDAPNATSKDLNEPTIYAAMLAVKHAFIVDNFNCGANTLGKLNVYGTVAGLYTNGFTGADIGGTFHGYPLNANYDNRLQVEEPPHFLNPVQAAWYVQRQTIAPNP